MSSFEPAPLRYMADSRLGDPCLNEVTCKEGSYRPPAKAHPRSLGAQTATNIPHPFCIPTSALPFAGTRANSIRYCRFPLRKTNKCTRLERIMIFGQTRQPASAKKERKRKRRRSVIGGVEFTVFMNRSMSVSWGYLLVSHFTHLVLYTKKGKRAWYPAVCFREI